MEPNLVANVRDINAPLKDGEKFFQKIQNDPEPINLTEI